MKAVGIKNLKNNLSKYLDMVREGEIVYVTDRDDIIAEIHKPVSAPPRMLSRWEAFLNEEEIKGSIIRAKHDGPSNIADILRAMKPDPGLDPSIGSFPEWKKILDDSREDRFP